jgi:hypothetical protein
MIHIIEEDSHHHTCSARRRCRPGYTGQMLSLERPKRIALLVAMLFTAPFLWATEVVVPELPRVYVDTKYVRLLSIVPNRATRSLSPRGQSSSVISS